MLLLVMFHLIGITAFGQDKEADLRTQLKEAKSGNNDKLSISTYIRLGDLYVKEGNVNKGQRFYRRGERINTNDKYPELAILFHQHYARSYYKQDDFDNALKSYERALSLAKKTKLTKKIAQLTKEISQFKESVNQRKKAKNELDELKSMNKEDAIKHINERNRQDSIENEEFYSQIQTLHSKNGLSKAQLRRYKEELSKKELRIELLDQYNQTKTAENERNKAVLALKDNELEKNEIEANRQHNIILFFIIGFILLVVIIFIVIFYYRRQKILNLLLMEKNEVIKLKNSEMISSLNYAQRIQNAVLLGNKRIDTYFADYFILNQPKNIVSGDFFWINKTKDNKTIWAVVDCTGHGVPGAFMSIIGNQMLNEIILEKNITNPGKILNEMKNGIIDSLNQRGEQGSSHDGMDMALCVWDPKTNILEYAGANNSIYICRENLDHTMFDADRHRLQIFENQLIEIKANRIPIGFSYNYSRSFDTFSIQLEKGDTIFATSDGFQDQFGGPSNKKYSTKRLKRLMIEVNGKSIHEYNSIFRNELIDWKGDYEQLDDICIVGVKI